MLRLIVKIGNTFKTYDFECKKLEQEYLTGDLVGIEFLSTNVHPRLISIDRDGTGKIKSIKAVREHTGMALKEAKEFVENTPIDLPQIDSVSLAKLINDLRSAGAVVET